MTKFWENHQDQLILFGKNLILSIIVLVLAWIVCKILRKVICRTMEKISAADRSLEHVFYVMARTFILLFAVLIILDLFGINTASILTVLGAAGLAVGLAMKDSLSNIASGLMLLILRPYKSGDCVECGSISGTVRETGLFTTILETADGIFIAAPNSTVFGNPVKNYSRNAARRGDITVSIAYGDSLPLAMETFLTFLNAHELILKNPAPEVLVTDLTASSMNLTLRFWTAGENYWTVYWQIKTRLKQVIEDAGLNMPRAAAPLSPPQTSVSK